MTLFMLGAVIGLLVGWNFLPQPEFIKALFEKIINGKK